jgi:hypothetical protein
MGWCSLWHGRRVGVLGCTKLTYHKRADDKAGESRTLDLSGNILSVLEMGIDFGGRGAVSENLDGSRKRSLLNSTLLSHFLA